MNDHSVLWDIQAEHLDDAAFLIWHWRHALFSPHFTLAEVADLIEARIIAHLDAMYIEGEAIFKPLLYPLLEEAEEPEQATAAALLLLAQEKTEFNARVFKAFESTTDEQQAAIALALQLTASRAIDTELKARKLGPPNREQALLLKIKSERGISIDPIPDVFFENDITAPFALNAIKYTSNSDYNMHIVKKVASENPLHRELAVEAGLVRHSQKVWSRCLSVLSKGDPLLSKYMMLVGLLGTSTAHHLLYNRLDTDTDREGVLTALGYIGTIESVRRCIPYLESDNDREAKLAAEAIALITGIDLEDDAFVVDESDEDIEEEARNDTPTDLENGEPENDADGIRFTLVMVDESEEEEIDESLEMNLEEDPVDELPLPNPSAIRNWVEKHKDNFIEDRRYLGGKPWDVKTHIEALEKTSMRRRHPLALKLLIESGADDVLMTESFSSRQRRQLSTLSPLKKSNIKDRSKFWS